MEKITKKQAIEIIKDRRRKFKLWGEVDPNATISVELTDGKYFFLNREIKSLKDEKFDLREIKTLVYFGGEDVAGRWYIGDSRMYGKT